MFSNFQNDLRTQRTLQQDNGLSDHTATQYITILTPTVGTRLVIYRLILNPIIAGSQYISGEFYDGTYIPFATIPVTLYTPFTFNWGSWGLRAPDIDIPVVTSVSILGSQVRWVIVYDEITE